MPGTSCVPVSRASPAPPAPTSTPSTSPSSTSPSCVSTTAATGSAWRRPCSASAPRLVLLDPLVRLHGVDENAVADIAPILGFLRNLQRRFHTAVLLVHHSRKSGATRPGQALRGSSELHAWGDSNLYLRRRDHQIVMTVEHRAARGLNDIEIELADDGQGAALRLRRQVPVEAVPAPQTAEQRIVEVLAEAEKPLSQAQIAHAPRCETPPSAPPSKNSSARDASNGPPKPATASPPPQCTTPLRRKRSSTQTDNTRRSRSRSRPNP